MCRRKRCAACGMATWAGCGAHVEQVLAGIPDSERCTCPPDQKSGLLARFLRKRSPS